MLRSPLVSLSGASSNSADQLFQLAHQFLKLGRLNQSLQIAYHAVQQDTSQKQTYVNHQVAVLQIGAEFAEEIEDYHRAAYYWQQLTQQQANNAEAWYGLGLAKANLQDYHSAEAALSRVLQLNSGHQKARLHLVEIQKLLSR